MSGAVEAATQGRHQMASVLAEGVEFISENQTITFVRYTRLVLPLDGYVFWVRAGTVLPTAVIGRPKFNDVELGLPPEFEADPNVRVVTGSLHYATYANQDQDDSGSLNKVIFTSEEEVLNLNDVDEQTLWLGSIDNIRFAFSRRESFYYQARLYHYTGDAVYPALATQLIDDPTTFDASELIVSNSLPVWLDLQSPTPYPGMTPGIGIPIYPSYLLPDNLRPPYAAVHVVPNATSALQAYPAFGPTYGQSQLATDRVEVTLYGATNRMALDFIDYVQKYCLYTERMGISNMPVPADDKRTQVELGVLAMKKTIQFDVNYNQGVTRDLAQQFILSCIPSILVDGKPPYVVQVAKLSGKSSLGKVGEVTAEAQGFLPTPSLGSWQKVSSPTMDVSSTTPYLIYTQDGKSAALAQWSYPNSLLQIYDVESDTWGPEISILGSDTGNHLLAHISPVVGGKMLIQMSGSSPDKYAVVDVSAGTYSVLGLYFNRADVPLEGGGTISLLTNGQWAWFDSLPGMIGLYGGSNSPAGTIGLIFLDISTGDPVGILKAPVGDGKAQGIYGFYGSLPSALSYRPNAIFEKLTGGSDLSGKWADGNSAFPSTIFDGVTPKTVVFGYGATTQNYDIPVVDLPTLFPDDLDDWQLELAESYSGPNGSYTGLDSLGILTGSSPDPTQEVLSVYPYDFSTETFSPSKYALVESAMPVANYIQKPLPMGSTVYILSTDGSFFKLV